VRAFTVLLFLLISFASQAQANLEALLHSSNTPPKAQAEIQKQLKAFLQPLIASPASSEKLLRKTFRKVQSTYLKKYEPYSDFDQLFSTGHYDCLTATSLFSYVLDQLHFSYEIVETNYHIFLMVQTSGGKVLLETTDRFGGLVVGEAAIRERASSYHQQQTTANELSHYNYRYSCSLYQQLEPEKLVGLLYFNQAVLAFNHHDWLTSAIQLEKASTLYASPRCEELGPLLIKCVLGSNLSEDKKSSCLVRLKNFWIKKSESIAVNN
jgi:hypothetical protein